jgi:hypothetical protein
VVSTGDGNHIYNVNPADPPERRYKAALEYLTADEPRSAYELLRQLLLSDGYRGSEWDYYYVLSMVSGRSWREVRGQLIADIKTMLARRKAYQPDRYTAALGVVGRMLDEMRYDVGGRPDAERAQATQDAFAALPAEHQEEINRHLDAMRVSMRDDQEEADKVRSAMERRMGRRRAERAWLFFEPEPARPRQDPVRPVAPAPHAWVLAVGGGCGLALGLAALAIGPFGLAAAFATLCLAAAAYLLPRYGAERATSALREEALRREFEPPSPHSARPWTPTAFGRDIRRLIEARFSQVRPHRAGNWPDYTAVLRARLEERLVRCYGNVGVGVGVEPDRLDWLIRKYAQDAADAWDPDAPPSPPSPARPRLTPTDALFYLGAALTGLGVALLAASGQWLAAALFAASVASAARGVVSIRSSRDLAGFYQDRSQELHAREKGWYEEWTKTLEDKPNDPEIAGWLAKDKIYLRTDAARRAGLTPDDLVDSIIMLEGGDKARKKRVPGRPPRYTAYKAQIFLLTRSGVRETKVTLDFLSGEVRDELRTSFRYDSLASTKVQEKAVRTTKAIEPDSAESIPANAPSPEALSAGREDPVEIERLRTRTLRLTLNTGQEIAVLGEDFRRATSNLNWPNVPDEDEPLADDLPGSADEGVLLLLEAVATEGSVWIDREKERRRRWAEEW